MSERLKVEIIYLREIFQNLNAIALLFEVLLKSRTTIAIVIRLLANDRVDTLFQAYYSSRSLLCHRIREMSCRIEKNSPSIG